MNYRRKLKTNFFSPVIAVVFCLFVGGTAFASTLTVSPALLRMSVSALQPATETALTLHNDTAQQTSYELRIVDVDVATGRLAPLSTTSGRTDKIFSLSTRIIQLDPGQTVPVSVQAKNSDELAPGGHYAAIEIRSVEKDAGVKAPLVQIVTVGIFLTKEDGAKRDLNLLTQKGGSIRFALPSAYEVALRNDGNVDVTPRGFVALTQGTKEHAKVQFNDTSRPVFAGQSTSYAVLLSGSGLLPGKYRLLVSYRADTGQQQVFVDEFWYIPPVWIFGVGAVLVSAFGVAHKKRRQKKNIKQHELLSPIKPTEPTNSALPAVRQKSRQRPIIVTDMAREAVRTHTPRTRKKSTGKKQTKKKK